MKKASKVVFIEDKLEATFYSLKNDEPIKKSLIRAIKDLKAKIKAGQTYRPYPFNIKSSKSITKLLS